MGDILPKYVCAFKVYYMVLINFLHEYIVDAFAQQLFLTPSCCNITTLLTRIIIFLHYRHSLLATQLLERARNKFQVELAVRDLFQFPTVASLATLIDSRLDKSRGGSPPVQSPQLDFYAEVERHDQGVSK